MDLNEYQQKCLRTTNATPTMERLTISGLGIAGEAGEVADLIKKVVGHGHDLDHDKLVKELGDVLWYVADLASTIGVTLNDVAEINVAKLAARYPDGFSVDRSRNRDQGA